MKQGSGVIYTEYNEDSVSWTQEICLFYIWMLSKYSGVNHNQNLLIWFRASFKPSRAGIPKLSEPVKMCHAYIAKTVGRVNHSVPPLPEAPKKQNKKLSA